MNSDISNCSNIIISNHSVFQIHSKDRNDGGLTWLKTFDAHAAESHFTCLFLVVLFLLVLLVAVKLFQLRKVLERFIIRTISKYQSISLESLDTRTSRLPFNTWATESEEA